MNIFFPFFLAVDETRVKLSVINDDPFSDYINANHVYVSRISAGGAFDQGLRKDPILLALSASSFAFPFTNDAILSRRQSTRESHECPNALL